MIIKYLFSILILLPTLLVSQTSKTEVINNLLDITEKHILDNTDDSKAKQLIMAQSQLMDHVQVDADGMVSAENNKELATKYLDAKNAKEQYLGQTSEEYSLLLRMRDKSDMKHGARPNASGTTQKPKQTKAVLGNKNASGLKLNGDAPLNKKKGN